MRIIIACHECQSTEGWLGVEIRPEGLTAVCRCGHEESLVTLIETEHYRRISTDPDYGENPAIFVEEIDAEVLATLGKAFSWRTIDQPGCNQRAWELAPLYNDDLEDDLPDGPDMVQDWQVQASIKSEGAK